MNWEQGYDFFKGQQKHPKKGTMSNITDKILEQHRKVGEERTANAAAFRTKNLGETSTINNSIDINTLDKTNVKI